VSIVRIGLAQTKNFSDGYEAIFGKQSGGTAPAKKAKASAKSGGKKKAKKSKKK
jgi:hypothetical protein